MTTAPQKTAKRGRSGVDIGSFPPAVQQQLRAKYQAATAASPFAEPVPRGTPPKRSKYGAQATVVDGYRFASKLEAALYTTLSVAWRQGELRWFIRQVPFDVAPGVRYLADFLAVTKDGRVRVLDAKGMDTPNSRTKRAVVEDRYGIRIETVTREQIGSWRP